MKRTGTITTMAAVLSGSLVLNTAPIRRSAMSSFASAGRGAVWLTSTTR
jgi:hypothetical protein